MTISVVQNTDHVWTDSGTALTAAFPSNVTAGNFLFVLVCSRNRTTSTVPTDTLGTTYVLDYVGTQVANNCCVYRSSVVLAAGGANTISLTHGFGDERQMVGVEVSGLESSPLDAIPAVAAAANWGTGNSTATSTGTLAQAEEINFTLITGRSSAAFSSITRPSSPSAYTGLGTAYMGGAAVTNSPGDFAYLIVNSTSALAPVWSSSGSGVFDGALGNCTYKGSGGGGSTARTRLTLLGVG